MNQNAHTLKGTIAFSTVLFIALAMTTTLSGCKSNIQKYSYLTVNDPVGSETLDLRVMLPETKAPDNGYPVIMFIHGGSWATGNSASDSIGSSMTRVTEQGYVAVSINYRLTRETTSDGNTRFPWPAQLQDAKCAVRWIKANQSNSDIFPGGINPSQIGAVGFSAGGHIALMLGETPNSQFDYPAFETDFCEHNASSNVNAVATYAGVADTFGAWFENAGLQNSMRNLLDHELTRPDGGTSSSALNLSTESQSLLQSINPSFYAPKNQTPVLLMHDPIDIIVKPSTAQCYFEAMPHRIENSTKRLLWFATGGHTFSGSALINNETVRQHADRQMLAWFDTQLKGQALDLPDCTFCHPTLPDKAQCLQ